MNPAFQGTYPHLVYSTKTQTPPLHHNTICKDSLEAIRRIVIPLGIKITLRLTNTLCQLLVRPKDQYKTGYIRSNLAYPLYELP